MPDAIDPYKVLQVDREAEDEVITAAYRRLARKYHPDLAVSPDASARMASINAAWELIGDPAKRAAYDRLRRAAAARPGDARGGPAAGGASGAGTYGASGAGARSGGGTNTGPGRRGSAGAGASAARPTGSAATGSSGMGHVGHAGPSASPRPGTPAPPPETVSRDWTSGRSSHGSGYDESMRTAGGFGAAGPPPGRPEGRVLNFGRYAGWSLGEIARGDLEYIEWLDRMPIGRSYRDEIDRILRSSGRRRSGADDPQDRRGLYRRR